MLISNVAILEAILKAILEAISKGRDISLAKGLAPASKDRLVRNASTHTAYRGVYGFGPCIKAGPTGTGRTRGAPLGRGMGTLGSPMRNRRTMLSNASATLGASSSCTACPACTTPKTILNDR